MLKFVKHYIQRRNIMRKKLQDKMFEISYLIELLISILGYSFAALSFIFERTSFVLPIKKQTPPPLLLNLSISRTKRSQPAMRSVG